VFRRRRRIILASAILVILLGALYCTLKTRRYEAVAYLAINPEGSNALDMGDITASLGGGGLGFDEKLETQVRILKSNSLAWTVISQLRLDKEAKFAGGRKYMLFGPRILEAFPDQIEQTTPKRRNQLLTAFEKSLTVTTVPRTQAVEITFRNSDAELARKIVNSLTSNYTQRTFMVRYDDTMKSSNWLSGQLSQLKLQADQAQSKLSNFQKQTGVFGTDENDNLVLSKLDDLSKELTDAEADRIVKESTYRLAQSGNPELIGTVVPDSVLPVLRGQEADLNQQLAEANSKYGFNYPLVTQLRSQLAAVDKSLKKEIAAIQERFRTEYQASADTERQIKNAFDQQKRLAYDMSDSLDQFGVLKREVESSNDLYEDLQKKLKEAGVVASLKAATIDVIDPAVLPTKPVEPNIPLVMALSVILGLGCGLGLAFIAESLDKRLRTQEEAESITGLSLFAAIPHIALGRAKYRRQGNAQDAGELASAGAVTIQRPSSHGAEAFRVLRTALLLSSAGTPPKTVLVTSGLQSEGKSTISINTAVVLTQRGKRVLLIDGDLRRGKIREILNIQENVGLSGSLTGSSDWRNAIVNIEQVPNLFFLQSGLRPPNSAELLGSDQMHKILVEARAEYDHIVIDSAPAVLVTDAVLLAQWVDVVLLVARIGFTLRKSLHRTAELLNVGKNNITGLVVNDMASGDSYYGYGYGYGYGAKSGYFSEEKS
jgi:capsular exopolysaccharide synthesis family protein